MKKLFQYAGKWSIEAYKRQEKRRKEDHGVCDVKFENVLKDFLGYVWDEERLKNKSIDH